MQFFVFLFIQQETFMHCRRSWREVLRLIFALRGSIWQKMRTRPSRARCCCARACRKLSWRWKVVLILVLPSDSRPSLCYFDLVNDHMWGETYRKLASAEHVFSPLMWRWRSCSWPTSPRSTCTKLVCYLSPKREPNAQWKWPNPFLTPATTIEDTLHDGCWNEKESRSKTGVKRG